MKIKVHVNFPLPIPICPEDKIFVKYNKKQEEFMVDVRFEGRGKLIKVGTATPVNEPMDIACAYFGRPLGCGLTLFAEVETQQKNLLPSTSSCLRQTKLHLVEPMV